MPLYLAGATRSSSINFGTVHWGSQEEESQVAPDATPSESEPETASIAPQAVSPVSPVSGEGLELDAVAYGLALRGRTNASFRSTFQTLNMRTTPGSGCTGCADVACVNVSGTLESTFRVTTRVSLPSVSDFPGLTPCQRERVQNAITTVLAPHEQEHVAAFNTYNGIVRALFDLSLCRSTFEARIKAMHDETERERQAAAQAASDALDPFEFEVDLNCKEAGKITATSSRSDHLPLMPPGDEETPEDSEK
jgi:hypothetical protein